MSSSEGEPDLTVIWIISDEGMKKEKRKKERKRKKKERKKKERKKKRKKKKRLKELFSFGDSIAPCGVLFSGSFLFELSPISSGDEAMISLSSESFGNVAFCFFASWHAWCPC